MTLYITYLLLLLETTYALITLRAVLSPDEKERVLSITGDNRNFITLIEEDDLRQKPLFINWIKTRFNKAPLEIYARNPSHDMYLYSKHNRIQVARYLKPKSVTITTADYTKKFVKKEIAIDTHLRNETPKIELDFKNWAESTYWPDTDMLRGYLTDENIVYKHAAKSLSGTGWNTFKYTTRSGISSTVLEPVYFVADPLIVMSGDEEKSTDAIYYSNGGEVVMRVEYEFGLLGDVMVLFNQSRPFKYEWFDIDDVAQEIMVNPGNVTEVIKLKYFSGLETHFRDSKTDKLLYIVRNDVKDCYDC